MVYSQMFSYEFKDEPKCKALYEKDFKYVSFNEFLSKTTSPQYLNVGNGERCFIKLRLAQILFKIRRTRRSHRPALYLYDKFADSYIDFSFTLMAIVILYYTLITSENQDVPKTVKDATKTVSTYTKTNLTRDTTCTCTYKFNDISTISKTFKIYEASRFISVQYISVL